MSTAYHPQTDGQTERVNQCLETYLRCFVHACPQQWSSWLSLSEFWYNTGFHTALQMSPFQALYGHQSNHFGIVAASAEPSPELSDWLEQRNLMVDKLKQHLQRAQHRMKSQADKNRTERHFSVGDFVYLKLQPYVQTSVMPRSNNKLSFKFFGPYEILEKLDSVAYKLKLPSTSTIHSVFHVSQLKQAPGKDYPVLPDLPPNGLPLQIPLKILQRRLVTRETEAIPQYLVQWSGMPSSLATWEDAVPLKQRFPRAPVWGQAGFQESGGVTSPRGSPSQESPEQEFGRGKRREGSSPTPG